MRCCCRFARDNCPSYLVEKNFNELKAGRLDGLNIFSGTFMDALKQRQYSKVGTAPGTFMRKPLLLTSRINLIQGPAARVCRQCSEHWVVISIQVILMDHVDWMDEAYAKSLAATLAQQVAPGGKVIWRSAALTPPYAGIIAAAGFKV